MSSGAGPFRNNILPRLIVRRKGKGDARESGPKVNADDQLRLAPTSTLDFDGGVPQTVLLGDPWGDSMGGGLLHAVAGRGTHGLGRRGGILHVGVDGGRVMGQLLARGKRTSGSTKGVTGRATQGILVHGETGGGGTMAGESRTRRCTVGRDRDVGRRGNLARGKGGVILIAFGPEAERFKARTHEVHVRTSEIGRAHV